jgi:hypothetical protein
MPLLDEVTADITQFLPPETVVFLDECKLLSDAGTLAEREFSERLSDLKKAGAAFGFTKWQQIPANDLWQTLTQRPCVALQTVVAEVEFFRPQQIFSLKTSESSISEWVKIIFTRLRASLGINRRVVDDPKV